MLYFFVSTVGYAIGSIEGRIGLEYFSEVQAKAQAQQRPNSPKPTNTKSFAFKCHRDNKDIFCINSIDFHRYNTFCTGGSDGVFSFWDKEARARLSSFEAHVRRCPVNVVRFSPMGNALFYAMSYDWSKGAEGNNPSMGVSIVMHNVLDSEIAPKKKV